MRKIAGQFIQTYTLWFKSYRNGRDEIDEKYQHYYLPSGLTRLKK